jgi:AraC family L-rhamnose operon transcriptional activator RhaR
VGVPVHVNHPCHEGDTPLHDHDFFELVLVSAGHGVHRTVQGEESTQVGDLFILHPGQWHAYERCRSLKVYNCCVGVEVLARELAWTRHDPHLAMVVPARLPAVGSPPPSHAGQGVLALRLTADETAACVSEMERIRALQAGGDPLQARPEIIARVLLLLSIASRRLLSTPDLAKWAVGVVDPPILKAREAMEDKLEHPWGLKELARLTKLNRFHLIRLFHRHIGCPPLVWLLRRRVEKAAVLLLTTDLPMGEIGRRVGWKDPNYFSRRFRAAFGLSPRDYRGQLPIPAQTRQSEDWVQW